MHILIVKNEEIIQTNYQHLELSVFEKDILKIKKKNKMFYLPTELVH